MPKLMKGVSKKALRYYIGNTLITFSMAQHDLGAALYGPLTVLVVELDEENTKFQYDKPSTLFGQFGHDDVTAVGLELDEKLKRLIEKPHSRDFPSSAMGQMFLRTTGRRPQRRQRRRMRQLLQLRRWLGSNYVYLTSGLACRIHHIVSTTNLENRAR